MKHHEQFEALKVGDIVVLRRGLDQGRKAEVVISKTHICLFVL